MHGSHNRYDRQTGGPVGPVPKPQPRPSRGVESCWEWDAAGAMGIGKSAALAPPLEIPTPFPVSPSSIRVLPSSFALPPSVLPLPPSKISSMPEYKTVAIVGVGLIGGSIGLALRERKLAQTVIGIGRRQQSLDAARKVGAIDNGVTNLAGGVAEAQLILVATPVDSIAERVVQVAAACQPGALITDAGSTKEKIVTAVDSALASRRSGPRFVGSHPIAGDHRTGPEHARADLFEDHTVIITPTEHTRPAAVTEVSGFWENLGAKVRRMSPADHDAALALTSHLPHAVAVALAAATPRELLPLTAGGWRDTTRVAAGDVALWQAIFAENRQHVVNALRAMERSLAGLGNSLEQGDNEALNTLLELAAKRKRERDALGD